MTETRRNAFRLNLGRAGFVRFRGRQIACVVVDISATGARMRITEPTLVPDRFTLAVELAGEEIAMSGAIRRTESDWIVAIAFDDPNCRTLSRLLFAEQRALITTGVQLAPERRRVRPKGPRPARRDTD